MKAIVVKEGLEGRPLAWEEVPAPRPGTGEVLMKVHAAALNRADLAQRAGTYPPPPGASDILGLEVAGRIAGLGAEVSGWEVGDEACVLLSGGGYAELVAAPAGLLMRVPDGWSLTEAAALPEAYITAYLNLFGDGRLEQGETVLIHAGASGVGLAAIQLATAAGARVIVTVGSDRKAEFCTSIGAHAAINYREQDVAEAVAAATDGEGVDLVIDLVGARHFEANIASLKRGGRLVFISAISGRKVELDISKVMSRRLVITGSTLRRRSLAEKAGLVEGLTARFGRHFESGLIRPVIDSVFPIEEAGAAHQRMADDLNIGKIVLKVRE